MQIQFNTVFSRFYRVSAKVNMVLTPVLQDIIIGSMIGDLTAERRNIRSNTSLHFKQSIINRLYVEHLYSLFQDYCGSPPKTLSRFDNRPDKMKEYGAIKFVTLSLPCFNVYRELFYNSEGQIILPENLEELLTARGLAYLIMDDGYKHRKALYISTESFSLDENEFLVKILKNKFNLEWTCSSNN